MLLPQDGYKAAIYCRLSRDEDAGQESNSIGNQRRMLTEYAEKNGYPIVNEYIDDGVSGTNFNRPDFQRMMEDVTASKVNMIITKDLSRLGRDYIATGQYIEQIFPRMGVRFIAINDGFDSLYDDDYSADMVPIKNYFNELHAKDTSKKTRAAHKSLAKAGKFIGSKAPFGYIKDPDDKHHLLVDEDAAEVIRLIFRYAREGLGYKAIARRLRDEHILNPNAYHNIKDPTFHRSNYWRQPHDWHPSSVKTILTNPTYLGKTVSGRRRVRSFKLKDIVRMPEEEWIVVEGTHEPLITQRVWDEVQKNLNVRKKAGADGTVQMFSGLLKCADCGYSMSFNNTEIGGRYNCSLYNVKGKGYCHSRSISYHDVYQIVFADIRRKAKIASHFPGYLLHQLERACDGVLDRQIKAAQKESQRIESRIAELDQIIAKLYEDRVLGRLPEEQLQKLFSKYDAEQKSLRERGRELEKLIGENEAERNDQQWFIKAIGRYEDLTDLNAAILNELIERIEVGRIQKIDGERVQEIRILYKKVGYVESEPLSMPDEMRAELVQLDRKFFERLRKQFEWTEGA